MLSSRRILLLQIFRDFSVVSSFKRPQGNRLSSKILQVLLGRIGLWFQVRSTCSEKFVFFSLFCHFLFFYFLPFYLFFLFFFFSFCTFYFFLAFFFGSKFWPWVSFHTVTLNSWKFQKNRRRGSTPLASQDTFKKVENLYFHYVGLFRLSALRRNDIRPQSSLRYLHNAGNSQGPIESYSLFSKSSSCALNR